MDDFTRKALRKNTQSTSCGGGSSGICPKTNFESRKGLGTEEGGTEERAGDETAGGGTAVREGVADAPKGDAGGAAEVPGAPKGEEVVVVAPKGEGEAVADAPKGEGGVVVVPKGEDTGAVPKGVADCPKAPVGFAPKGEGEGVVPKGGAPPVDIP